MKVGKLVISQNGYFNMKNIIWTEQRTIYTCDLFFC